MKHIAKFFGLLFLSSMFLLSGCGDDDTNPVVRYDIVAGNINSDSYSGGGTLVFEYSTDDGTSYSATAPVDLDDGQKVLVRVNDGTDPVSSANFNFDWSASSTDPANTTTDVAEFTITDSDITVNVSIADVIALVIIQRDNGQVKSVNTTSGATTDLFKFTLNSNDLVNLRSLVYNRSENTFNATSTAGAGGELYEIDVISREATVLNDNANDDWDGISDLVALSDGSLLSTLKDVALDEHVLMPFSDVGAAGTLVQFTGGTPDAGLGLVIDSNNDRWVGDYPGEIHISDNAGAISSTLTLSADASLPNIDLTESYPQNLAWGADNVLYATIYDDTNDVTYIVEVNTTSGELSMVSDLGSTRHHGLAGIPLHLTD